MKIQNICVYCGSNSGRIPAYAEAARELARELVRRDIGLVYGGASVGIMGIVADAVMAEGGRVLGIIPEPLMRKELGHSGLTEPPVVPAVHERKHMMAERAAGLVALPGGHGPPAKILSTLSWGLAGQG